ncbi:hydroxymethylbilane synthase [Lewinella marina]|uniref:Hydroxymethylbilane synthase n=1 Tax=Neolewinella marina TaxID=438751 RepID=A0A2G0CIK2_9BACT|nr:hydroxymethylbilane synthase [Neolewinella marina]NJB85041.1 hydroxymethylbilane synthase [Neolewinella marina]PHK99813.1 hydroxymethylbilane synthase [Neolewinella marina]
MIRIGTRGSRLALWQAHFVQAELRKHGLESELEVIKTQGDRIQHLGFDKLEGKGFFTKEIEDALLEGRIDCAVHSLKDLPTNAPDGLVLAALSYRASVEDVVLIHRDRVVKGQPLWLGDGATIGTSSNRRKAILKDLHPGLETVDIRGNVPTRMKKALSGELDAVVLAAAGLERLELDLSELEVIRPSPREFVPAPGQGVMAVQTREEDIEMRKKLSLLHHPVVGECTNVERKVLNLMEGGCSMPLGVYCEKDQLGNFHVWAAYAPDATAPLRRVQLSQSTRAGLPEAVVEQLLNA